ncbi:DUF5776 domain-containing protein [Lentilactobacillus hilgardii]|uniref:DUF5776 domain-containing protein n=1 Tax=Lentilactobacillus hilgardii TaxID=1588 RepID=UPI0021A8EF72|nr:DUF5776 domain-containing protein [Lentilactobacillus hilgardii]
MKKASQPQSLKRPSWFIISLLAVISTITLFIGHPLNSKAAAAETNTHLAVATDPDNFSIAYGSYDSPTELPNVIGSIIDLGTATEQNPIEFTPTDGGQFYIDDMVDGNAVWTVNNDKITMTDTSIANPNVDGYVASGLDKLVSGTVLLFTARHGDGTANHFYFKIITSNTIPEISETNAGYGVYDATDVLTDFTNMQPNTSENPIAFTASKGVIFYVEDINDDKAVWTSDNANLTLTKNSDGLGYRVTGLDSVVSGTVVKFTARQSYDSTSDYYFKITNSNTPAAETDPGYALYDANSTVGQLTGIKPNTAQSPVALAVPDDGRLYLADPKNAAATWTTDNDKIKVVKDATRDGYQVTGLNSLTPGTVVKFTVHYPNGVTGDFYFKFGTASTPGGGSTGGSNTTAGGSNTTTGTTGSGTPNGVIPPATSNGASTGNPGTGSSATTASGQRNGATPAATSNTAAPTAKNVAAKGTVIYGLKKVGLYKSPTFKASNRLAWYPKQKRINRPMFVVTGYARSANGALRYKVRDVNHGRKTAGKVGYITANKKYVGSVYYATVPKSKKITVIAKTGINAYKSATLTGKAKHYKTGTRLTIKKLVKHNLTTRYQLSNGMYITANKKLVIVGNN